MGISVLVPTIRPEGAERIKALLSVDNTYQDYEIISDIDNERIGCPLMLKNMVEKAQFDRICFLGDDTIPMSGMLQKADEAMNYLPDKWGMVGLNDGYWNGNELATHWICHKKFLPHLDGEFFYTGYLHTSCDNELIARVKALDRYVWAQEAKLEHINPIIRHSAKSDADYARVYSPKWRLWDQCLFWSRRQNNWETPDFMFEKERPIPWPEHLLKQWEARK